MGFFGLFSRVSQPWYVWSGLLFCRRGELAWRWRSKHAGTSATHRRRPIVIHPAVGQRSDGSVFWGRGHPTAIAASGSYSLTVTGRCHGAHDETQHGSRTTQNGSRRGSRRSHDVWSNDAAICKWCMLKHSCVFYRIFLFFGSCMHVDSYISLVLHELWALDQAMPNNSGLLDR